jgi:hypothetical protein
MIRTLSNTRPLAKPKAGVKHHGNKIIKTRSFDLESKLNVTPFVETHLMESYLREHDKTIQIGMSRYFW